MLGLWSSIQNMVKIVAVSPIKSLDVSSSLFLLEFSPESRVTASEPWTNYWKVYWNHSSKVCKICKKPKVHVVCIGNSTWNGRYFLSEINCSYLMLMFSYQHEESTCTFTLHVGEENERSIYSICFIHSAREFTWLVYISLSDFQRRFKENPRSWMYCLVLYQVEKPILSLPTSPRG